MTAKDWQIEIVRAALMRGESMKQAAAAAGLDPATAKKWIVKGILPPEARPRKRKKARKAAKKAGEGAILHEREMFELWDRNRLMTAPAVHREMERRHPGAYPEGKRSSIVRCVKFWRGVFGVGELPKSRAENLRNRRKGNTVVHMNRPGSTDVEELTRRRIAAGITKVALARAAGVREATLTDWEKGRYIPEKRTLAAVCEALLELERTGQGQRKPYGSNGHANGKAAPRRKKPRGRR